MCPNCQTQYPEYAREYNYCPNCGVNLTESMFDELKRELWMNGTEAIDDFFGYEYDVEEDKDVTENRMTEIMLQMPPEEFMKYYNKYCARKDNENIC